MKTFIVTGQYINMIDTVTGTSRKVESSLYPRKYNETLKLILSNQLEEAFDQLENLSSETTNVAQVRAEVRKRIIEEKTKGRFTYQLDEDGTVRLSYKDAHGDDVAISDTFLKKVLSIFNDPDADIEPIDRFIEKVESNNFSDIAANDLFEFLAVNKHPITTDGDFLAFKIVRDDLLDFHSKTVLHEVGSIVAIHPDDVDYNRDNTCSRGLHFCSRDYLPQYGGFFGNKNDCALLILKISPADVAAFPRDYRNAKGRAVKYQVMARIPNDHYHAIIENLVTQDIVDVKKDLTDISSITTRVYRQLSGEEQFEEVVEKQVQDTLDVVNQSAGPVPTIQSSRWQVLVTYNATGRRQCVANCKTRADAREKAREYNDMRTESQKETIRYFAHDWQWS